MRDEVYVAGVIGKDGAAVVTDIEGAEKAFGEAAMADFVKKTGIDLSASIDVSRPLGDRPETSRRSSGRGACSATRRS